MSAVSLALVVATGPCTVLQLQAQEGEMLVTSPPVSSYHINPEVQSGRAGQGSQVIRVPKGKLGKVENNSNQTLKSVGGSSAVT